MTGPTRRGCAGLLPSVGADRVGLGEFPSIVRFERAYSAYTTQQASYDSCRIAIGGR